MEFNKSDFNKFRSAVKIALADVEKQFDISVDTGSIKYSVGKFTLKLEAKKNSVNGMSSEQAEWNRHCRNIGLNEADFGKTITLIDGTVATISSIHPKRWKRPVGVTTSSGKRYIMEVKNVTRQLVPEGGA